MALGGLMSVNAAGMSGDGLNCANAAIDHVHWPYKATKVASRWSLTLVCVKEPAAQMNQRRYAPAAATCGQ